MYSVSGYGEMIADEVRMAACISALRQAITPDSIVLDIGTGTGIFALLACKLGAKRVYGIEPADAIQMARKLAAANGCGAQIVFFQNLSTGVSLPERADVIISDLRGVLPLYQNHIAAIVDARRRFLAAGGALIPQSDSLWAAVVNAPKVYADYVAPWGANGYGLDLRSAHGLVLNTWRKARVTSDQLLVEPRCWAELDYSKTENPNVHAELEWTVSREGTAHGLSVWFDTVLIDGVGFSNGPDAPELIYGSAFFPWLEPVDLKVGDRLVVHLGADLVGDDYIWRWDTRVLSLGDPTQVKADFKQSTFFGVPLSLVQLHKRAANYVPTLNDDGQINRFVLSLFDGTTSLQEIALQLTKRFPERFRDWGEALNEVSQVSQKFSR